MATIDIFALSADPLGAGSVTVGTGYTVTITDDDTALEDPDSNSTTQFDTSGVPGLSNSNDFEVFETYGATVGGQPVSFVLMQWSGTPYMFVTSGVINSGDTILNPVRTIISSPPSNYEDIPSYVCFVDGTRIATRNGPVLVETLKVGDAVLTLDNGYQPIRWIGACKLDAIDLRANPNLKPIRIRAGALGSGLPETDLSVSPQHRVLIRSAVAWRMFGAFEVLMPAKKLLDLDGIDIDLEASSVGYNHILFDQHEIVFSNGAPTESLHPGVEALKSVGRDAYQEISTLFPEITCPGFKPMTARPVPKRGAAMQNFASRIVQNKKVVLEWGAN